MAKRTQKMLAPKHPVLIAVNAAEVPSTYVNGVQVLGVSAFDVRLGFNEVLIEDGMKLTCMRRANVVMSPSHFEAMVQVLEGVLAVIRKNQAAIQSESTTPKGPPAVNG